MPLSEFPKFSVLDDSPKKRTAPSPQDREEDNTEQARDMHARSAEDHTRESTVSDFWTTYVKRNGYEVVSAKDLAVIIDQLKADKHIATDGQWKQLKTRRNLRTENAHFGRLVHVVDAIVTAAATRFPRFALVKRTCLFECRPDNKTLSEVPGASFHVDAIHYLAESTYTSTARAGSAHCSTMLSREQTRNINMADVVASWEVKLAHDIRAVRDDEEKTIGVAGHYLFADIRRKFHFSITVEKTTAKLWCHSRSHSVVTKAFDIHKHKDELIQWILFVSYGTEYQLGFDPTVIRVLDKHNRWQYQFDVRHRDGMLRTYQTREILHENCAAALYMRAMRVFKVRLVTERGNGDSFSEEYPQARALRDYWLNDDKQTRLESEIQDAVFAALRACTSSEEEALEILKHFMGILADGVVQWDDEPDCVPGPPKAAEPYIYMDDKNPKGTKASGTKVKGSDLRAKAGYVGPGKAPKPVVEVLQLLGRKHCRTLYDHVCIDLYKVHDPAIFFFALERAVYVLTWFRRIGWMHRDISPGNVMLHCLRASLDGPLSERYVLKLADLEYCREYSRISQHDSLTGTGDYMAIETQLRQHIFFQGKKVQKLAAEYFSHNFFHDLESTIWMALEFAMRHAPRQLIEKGWPDIGRVIDDMRYKTDAVFPCRTEATKERQDLLEVSNAQKKLESSLLQIYGEQSPVPGLVKLLDKLGDAYIDVESRVDLDDAPRDADGQVERMPASLFEEFSGIYEEVRAAFQQISQYYADKEGQDHFIPFSRIDFDTGEILQRPTPASTHQSSSETEVDEADEAVAKRKAADDSVTLPRSKRSRTLAPPSTAPAPRKTRSRTIMDTGRPVRRSDRLRNRTNDPSQ
ncbi:hypothetical protein HDZ31DRAFT_71142 [Schizophyllum fasciatum]